MKDLVLKASVKATMAKDRAVEKVRAMANGENGDIVQTVIIIALFVIICVVVGGILYDAINSQATKTGNCITNINSKDCTTFKR